MRQSECSSVVCRTDLHRVFDHVAFLDYGFETLAVRLIGRV